MIEGTTLPSRPVYSIGLTRESSLKTRIGIVSATPGPHLHERSVYPPYIVYGSCMSCCYGLEYTDLRGQAASWRTGISDEDYVLLLEEGRASAVSSTLSDSRWFLSCADGRSESLLMPEEKFLFHLVPLPLLLSSYQCGSVSVGLKKPVV